MTDTALPPEAAFVPLAARQKRERANDWRNREPKIVAMATNGAHPFGPADGILEPTAWHGAKVPPRHWIVKDLIPTGEVTMLTGNGGEGKSLITMQLLIAAATGTRWLGRPIKSVRAMGVYCEDDKDELHRRSSHILGGERMEFASLDGLTLICRKRKDNIIYEAHSLDITGQFNTLFQRLRTTVIEWGIQVLVLDSLYDFFGGNENQKLQAKHFINGLAELAYDINGAVIIVAHPSKSGMGKDGDGTAGSVAWHNAVRSRLYLHRRKPAQWELDKNPEAQGPLILQPMKANYAPKESAIELCWEEGRFVPVVDPTLSRPPARDERNMFGDN